MDFFVYQWFLPLRSQVEELAIWDLMPADVCWNFRHFSKNLLRNLWRKISKNLDRVNFGEKNPRKNFFDLRQIVQGSCLLSSMWFGKTSFGTIGPVFIFFLTPQLVSIFVKVMIFWWFFDTCSTQLRLSWHRCKNIVFLRSKVR